MSKMPVHIATISTDLGPTKIFRKDDTITTYTTWTNGRASRSGGVTLVRGADGSWAVEAVGGGNTRGYGDSKAKGRVEAIVLPAVLAWVEANG